MLFFGPPILGAVIASMMMGDDMTRQFLGGLIGLFLGFIISMWIGKTIKQKYEEKS